MAYPFVLNQNSSYQGPEGSRIPVELQAWGQPGDPIEQFFIDLPTAALVYSTASTQLSITAFDRLEPTTLRDDGLATLTVWVQSMDPDSVAPIEFAYRAYDGEEFSGTQFVRIDITPVNDAPSFFADEFSSLEDGGLQVHAGWAYNLLAGPPDESGQALQFQIAYSPNLFTVAPTLSSDGTLTYQTAPNVYGDIALRVVLKDDGGTENGGVDSYTRDLKIHVVSVNDAPTIVLGAGPRVQEDSGPQVLSAWASGITAGAVGEEAQDLTFRVEVDNDQLFAQVPKLLPDGTLVFTPAPDRYGSANVTVTVQDDGGTAWGGIGSTTKTFAIQVDPVNDAPSFELRSSEISVAEDTPFEMSSAAFHMDAGSYEDQTYQFNVSTDNDALFEGLPSIDVNGRLTFQPALNAYGTAHAMVTMSDSEGGTSSQALTIHVLPQNDVPVVADDTGFKVEAGGVLTIQSALLLANDMDVEGPLRLDSVVTATQLGARASYDPATGTVSYFATAGQFDNLGPGDSLTDSFAYWAQDSDGFGAIGHVFVTVQGATEGPTVYGTVHSDNGPTQIVGTGRAERIEGSNGDDVIFAYAGADHVLGQNGSDILHGGEGADVMWGGNGADILDGGAGSDELLGGEGRDVFFFDGQTRPGDVDKVADFQVRLDHLRLADGLSLLSVEFKDVGSVLDGSVSASLDKVLDTVCTLSNGAVVELLGVSGVTASTLLG